MPSVDRAREHVAGCRYGGMPFALLDRPPCFLRQELLGSEAVYEILEEDDELVTAEVVSAPGLPRGTRVRLLAKAVRAMERGDRFEPVERVDPVRLAASRDASAPRRLRVGAR
jgi:hypothetical protein